MRSIAIFGGTFDPVHNGHLLVSQQLQREFQFDHFYFLPCKLPTLKAASHATSAQRVAMLQLALQQQNTFQIDLREIERDTPSYMVETLKSFRQEYKEDSITLIVGYDAFLSLPQWHHWKELNKLAHILVLNRPGYSEQLVPQALQDMLKTQLTTDKESLLTKRSGLFMFYDAGNYDISSSHIRKALKNGYKAEELLPAKVREYITTSQLYL